jgi:putative phosphoserine phosphatase/1-acylglycerol-3-phosphate O-acyltransferase
MSITQAIAEIEAGPKGSEIGAFFDFDGTLIDGYSAVAYYTDKLWRREMRLSEAADLIRIGWHSNLSESEFASFIAKSIAQWAGYPEQEIADRWSFLFKKKIAALLFPEAWLLVKAHQKMGHTVTIASSATVYQIAPLARELEIEHLLCTQAIVRDGHLTGGIDGEPPWGVGKANAVRHFAKEHNLVLSNSYGYANGNEDIAFLRTVGHATAVNPKRILIETAQCEGWKVLQLPTRHKVSILTRISSFGAYCALALSSLGGLIYGIITGKKREAAEWVGATSSDMMLKMTGIHINIQGEQHLWAHRPSVFVFNHQSYLDGYVLFKLLRRDITGIAKKEVANTLLIGQLLRALDFAFIDRSDIRSAIETMKPAVDRLRSGLSIVIAPEGTRSLSPKLGRFKKGAFHLAMQASVPVVPIVIRNDYEMMVRNSLIFRPGTVQVCVLPPIDVSKWRIEDLDRHITEVQELFRRTLDDWPRKGG